MRTIRLYIDTGYNSTDREVDFEVDNDATDEEIGKEAEEIFWNHVNFGWSEIDPEC